ncbi:MAG TPA: prolyl oligopeptidase family serine peptidase, partial [Bacillota bacterium]|nr:prolyl oligopeptidase family serine peptidase [Bacillota bacterium]
VFCPDARGAGENREFAIEGKDDPRWATSSCKDFNNTAISLGQTLIGMQTWDLMRLVDYIETLDYCDPSRIGCCGHSGGGWQTLWLTALDARIRCAIVSGYFHGFRDTILKTNRCGCNFVPGLWEMIDVGDLAALIAPRPLLIESGAFDRLNGERGLVDVTEQLDITRRAYQVHQVEERLVQHIFDDVHRWDGAKMPEFLGRWL